MHQFKNQYNNFCKALRIASGSAIFLVLSKLVYLPNKIGELYSPNKIGERNVI